MNLSTLVHGSIGAGGTVATVGLAKFNGDVATLAGLLTCAWMLRQLWLSFRKKKRKLPEL